MNVMIAKPTTSDVSVQKMVERLARTSPPANSGPAIHSTQSAMSAKQQIGRALR